MKEKKEEILDYFPQKNINGNLRNEDLKIVDFIQIYLIRKNKNYSIPVYILTDRIISCDDAYYETMVRIGFLDNCEFLFSVEERCFSKLEAYTQHKRIYKKLLKGFYTNEILEIVKKLENRGNF